MASMRDIPMQSSGLSMRGLAVAVAAVALAGCSRPAEKRVDHPPVANALTSGDTPGTRRAPTRETKEYKLVGEIRKIDKEIREVTIRHEAIPGFMAAMTMPFHVDDQAVLDDLRAGDEVEGKLQVEQENGETRDYRLVDLAVSKPALAAPLVLDLSGKTPQIRLQPKRLEPGEPVPDFTMTGQDGKTFKLSDLRRHVVVLTFIYTRCPLPNFCPYMDRKFADLAQTVAAFPRRAEAIRLLSVSFDPEHDTPEILRQHARIRGGTPPLWTFASASHDELSRVSGTLGLVYGPGKDEIIHNLCTAVIDPEGRLARLEIGTQRNKWSSADLLKTVYSLIPAVQK